MGFMAGFADGFAKSFQASETRRHERQQDAFRISYDNYMKRRDEYDTAKKNDQALVDTAKGAVAMAQAANPNIPESAWEHAYRWAKTGTSADKIVERLEKTTFAATTTPSMAEEAPQPVDLMSQTQQSGLTPQPVAKQPEPTSPQGQGGLLGNLAGMFDPNQANQRRMDRANGEVATQVGQEQFDQVSAGYTPTQVGAGPEITGYNASEGGNGLGGEMKDQQVVMTADGNTLSGWIQADGTFKTQAGETVPKSAVQSVMSMEEFGKYQTLISDVGDAGKPLMDKRAATQSAMLDIDTLAELVRKNPEGITAGGQLSATIDQWSNDVFSILQAGANLLPKDWVEAEQKAEIKLREAAIADGFDPRAAQEIATMMVKVQYSAARAINGAGALANTDTRAAERMFSSNDLPTFLEQAQLYKNSLVDAYNSEAKHTRETDPRIRQLGTMQGGKALIDGFMGDLGSGDDLDRLAQTVKDEGQKEKERVSKDNLDEQENETVVQGRGGIVDDEAIAQHPALKGAPPGKKWWIVKVGNQYAYRWDD